MPCILFLSSFAPVVFSALGCPGPSASFLSLPPSPILSFFFLFLLFAHSHLLPVLYLSFIHSQLLFFPISFVLWHLLSSVSFLFVCSFVPTFCFFFFYPLSFLHSVPPSLYLICFFCVFASSFLFCLFFICWLIGTIFYPVWFFSFIRTFFLFFSFVYSPSPSYIRTLFLFCFFPSFIRTFFLFCFIFFIRLHLLSFMFPSFVVYHIYSILFIFFVHSHLLSILNVSLIPSCFPCFAVLIPSDIVFVLFISLLPLRLLSARRSVFLCLKIPLLNKGNFAKLHLYNSSAEATSVISQDYNTVSAKTTSVSAKKDKDAFPPLRTVTSQFPLPPCAGHAPFLPAPARGGF